MLCAIHQPNFFPWLGYFNKIAHADVFVFLDNVAYPKSGSGTGSWVNRVKVMQNKQAAWLGCPIKRKSGIQLIKDVQIDGQQPWKKKALRTLELNYCRSPHYVDMHSLISELINFPNDNLADYNIHAITRIAQVLNIKTTFLRQSELAIEGQSTMLLINIVKTVNCDAYLCGGGASGYQDDDLFAKHQIELKYQNYVPAAYTEFDFIPGLSIIDYLARRNKIEAQRII